MDSSHHRTAQQGNIQDLHCDFASSRRWDRDSTIARGYYCLHSTDSDRSRSHWRQSRGGFPAKARSKGRRRHWE